MGKHRCTPSMLSAARLAREPVSASWYPGHSPVTSSRSGRRVRDQCWLIGGEPPHQVIVPGMGVGVLGGQLGLAHPPIPCTDCTVIRGPAASPAATAANSELRPVKFGFRAGTFHTPGIPPGNRARGTARAPRPFIPRKMSR